MKKPIPGFSSYDIDEYGNVYHRLDGTRVSSDFGRRGRELRVSLKNDSWKIVKPKVSRLVMTTFRPLLNIDYNWVSVRYKDNDFNRPVLDNLEWEHEGYRAPFDATNPRSNHRFVLIPGYSNYEVCPSGVVRNRLNLNELSFSLSSSGYYCCRITNDMGISTYVGLHHLMCLALLSHPTDTDQLVVNHLDGVKIHNKIANMEWSSYSGNIIHAHYTGLRKSIVKVYARHWLTGERKVFKSINETARFFNNSNPGKIYWWLHEGIPNKIREGWYVSLEEI